MDALHPRDGELHSRRADAAQRFDLRLLLLPSCFTLLSVIIGLASQRIASMSTLALIKYSCACCLLACSAFSYLQSVRYLNTCGFLFQCATDKRDASYSPANVMLLMVLANNAWSLGERSLYLLAPAVIWLVAGGPVMLASLGFLLPVLYFYDLPAPVDLDPDSDDLKPYAYLKSAGPLDFFGFQTAVKTARREAPLYEANNFRPARRNVLRLLRRRGAALPTTNISSSSPGSPSASSSSSSLPSTNRPRGRRRRRARRQRPAPRRRRRTRSRHQGPRRWWATARRWRPALREPRAAPPPRRQRLP